MNVDAEEIWGEIRATRANPPAPAKSTTERRRTYGTALEQAQQMFRAAEAVGPQTQPLLVFYGLSQAGRAIAATSASTLADGDRWRLHGHGIYARVLNGPLPEIQGRSDSAGDRGSFVRLSEILDSPLLPKAAKMRLGNLWDCIPGNREQPLNGDLMRRRTPLSVEARHLTDMVKLGRELDPHPLVTVDVCDFPPRGDNMTPISPFRRPSRPWPLMIPVLATMPSVAADLCRRRPLRWDCGSPRSVET